LAILFTFALGTASGDLMAEPRTWLSGNGSDCFGRCCPNSHSLANGT
jgi:hypothetical protein